MNKFPQHLTRKIIDSWPSLISGSEYDRPPLPPTPLLRRLLEICYLVSLETDEGRQLRFTVCCTPNVDTIRRHNSNDLIEPMRFDKARDFNVGEVRRLAATTDVDSSALLVSYSSKNESCLRIQGLINQGSSWASARRAFSYWYMYPPSALIVRVLGPGRLSVYQGVYLIATLSSGQVQEPTSVSELDFFGVFNFFQEGIDHLSLLVEGNAPYLPTLEPETYEPPNERYGFEWMAYLNTILSIINVIQLKGHGGALILAKEKADLLSKQEDIKIKYRFASNNDVLQKRFVEFIRLRNIHAELQWRQTEEPYEPSANDCLLTAGSRTRESSQLLAEAATFIGNLAGADGAIVLTNVFSVDGFSAEITAEKTKESKIYTVTDTFRNKFKPLDVEQFGMRHRSAIKLCSNTADAIVFVISQDGEVSLVWGKDKDVMVRRNINITNANMVLA